MFAPPTDSLYKFIAIFGLIILGWGIAAPYQKSYEYKLKMAELNSAIDGSKNKAEQLQESYKSLLTERKNLEHEPNNPETILKEAAIDNKKQQLYIELLEAQQPVDEKTEVMKVLNEAMTTYKLLGIVSVFGGLLLTLSGFWLWYVRIQKHIDMTLLQDNNNKGKGA